MAAILDAQNNRLAIDPGGTIQHEGKRNLFGGTDRHHRAERKALLGEVTHHAAVGGRELDVDEGQRAFSVLRPALGLQSHGSSC